MDKIRTLNLEERISQVAANLQRYEHAVTISHNAPGCVSLYNEEYDKYQILLDEFIVKLEQENNALSAELEREGISIKSINEKSNYRNCLKVVR